MLLYGPDIMTESYTQETLSIAQLIVYNSMNSRKHAPASSHHAKKRETPSQLYLGIMIHCQTRKRGLIDKFFKLGLSVSYTRILSISADITNSLCRQYQNDGFVCPSSLREGLFTLAAVDNIDHNPSATSAKSSFHGTGISLFQNTQRDNQGAPRPKIDIDHTTNIRITEELPESYAVVKPVSVWPKNPEVPEIDKEIVIGKTRLLESRTKEYRWLHHMETSTKPDTTAYAEYVDGCEDNAEILSLDEWIEKMQQEHPQFNYWYMTLQLEIDALIFISSIRQGDFELYIEALSNIIPWFFALDHIHYSRWLPVHVRDLALLQDHNPQLFHEFSDGQFVVFKSKKKFSAIAVDHAHEQNNALVKSDGGAIGLTESPVALRRWMIAGPEMARLVQEFEISTDPEHETESDELESHHEDTTSTQLAFHRDVTALVEVIDEMDNPFLEDSKDLLVLDTKDIASESVIETVRNIKQIGKEQYTSFIKERLEEKTVSIYEPIKRNSLALFSTPIEKKRTSAQGKISSLKSDLSLFSRLYIACQSRGSDLDEFFEHENQKNPPSLSQNGTIRQCDKSDLSRKCLEPLISKTIDNSQVNATIIDGAAVVNMLKPGAAKTFHDYAVKVFVPYIVNRNSDVGRVDVVWDTYVENSLKSATREKRRKGIRRRVQAQTNIPKNWHGFLRVDENKRELFQFLSENLAEVANTEKKVICTVGENVISNQAHIDKSKLQPCKHEEADTRVMIHVADAVRDGFKKISIKTVDTDVIVIAISVFKDTEADEIWIAFATGKHFRYIPIHDIAQSLGPLKSRFLPIFHAFTGCDTISSFAGRGKKTAWDTWNAFPEVSAAFRQMTDQPSTICRDSILPLLERHVVLLYDRTSESNSVHEARKVLFAHKGRSIESVPPTREALYQHAKRSVYQAGLIWIQCLLLQPVLPSPDL
ncbi:unnamed protein product [Mytilus coruscus]|uniref:Uncharacterized protein n=1 Tax=Mytilus coruscus TaxID=42192 RepID=A0A6J8ESY5_MYTCO|nr:unnamed protein product [Mytilus coruscus]